MVPQVLVILISVSEVKDISNLLLHAQLSSVSNHSSGADAAELP